MIFKVRRSSLKYGATGEQRREQRGRQEPHCSAPGAAAREESLCGGNSITLWRTSIGNENTSKRASRVCSRPSWLPWRSRTTLLAMPGMKPEHSSFKGHLPVTLGWPGLSGGQANQSTL